MQTSFVCVACGNEQLISDQESGELVCSCCGVVIADRIEDLAHDARVFSGTLFDDRRRTGPHYSLSQLNKGFSTRMGKQNYGGRGGGAGGNGNGRRGGGEEGGSGKMDGNRISSLSSAFGDGQNNFDRIRLWDSRIRNAHEKGLEGALNELERLRASLGLPEAVVERSAYFIRKASELGLIRGRTIASMMAASVYLACRESETPKGLDEIVKASATVTRKRLSRDYRLLLRTFDEHLPVTDLSRCLTKIANIVGVSESRKRQAIEFANVLTSMEISAGRSPLGLAAAALYIVCKNTEEERTQKVLAEAAGVTEVTIRNRCSELARLISSKKIPHFNSSSLAALAFVSIQFAVVTNAWRHLPLLVH